MTKNVNTSTQLRWLLAATAVAALGAGCGGGSGDASEPPAPVAVDRIEPYDTGDVASKSAAFVERTVSAGARARHAAAKVSLGPVASEALPASAATKATQIGVARKVPALATEADMSAVLHWVDTGRNTRVAAVSVTSQDAKGVRLGLRVQSLPRSAVLRFYAQAGEAETQVTGAQVMDTIERNRQSGAAEDAARTYWSPDFGGPETTMEVEIPATSAAGSVVLSVPSVSHYVVSPEAAQTPAVAKAGEVGDSCEVDVMCQPELLSQTRSVARMLFVRDGKSYVCTGTLLNDTRSSGTPYLLSANHCIASQMEASSLISDWFYRSSSCNSGVVNAGAQRLTGGAVLLYATATTDTAFMRLNDPAPAGVVYAGSYFGGLAPGPTLVGVHHPNGGLQKASTGVFQRFSVCGNQSCTDSNATQGTFMAMGWSKGIVEGGSSGSGLFHAIGSKRYVVGQLYGGTSSCADPTGRDYYGRFDVAYRNALKQWLSP